MTVNLIYFCTNLFKIIMRLFKALEYSISMNFSCIKSLLKVISLLNFLKEKNLQATKSCH